MRQLKKRIWARSASGLGVLVACWPGLLQAKTEGDSPYTLSQTYGAALRLLRVDLGLEVLERDPEASYLIFHYRLVADPKRLIDGAIELVSLGDHVKIIIKIPQLPESHERLIRDRLVKKLRDDFGVPPKRVDPPKPTEPTKPPENSPDKPVKP